MTRWAECRWRSAENFRHVPLDRRLGGFAAEASRLSRQDAHFANVLRFADWVAQLPGHGIVCPQWLRGHCILLTSAGGCPPTMRLAVIRVGLSGTRRYLFG